MQVTNDTTVVESITRGAPGSATPPPASPVSDAVSSDRRSRANTRQNPTGSAARFRSVLDSLTVAGLGKIANASSDAPISTDGVTEPTTKFTRAGTPSRDVSGQDSEILFRATKAYAFQAKQSAPREADTGDGDTETASTPAFKNVALNASKQYAQAFFALDRTFAARGETLEIST